MKIGKFDTDKEVLIIAEIGNNHEGSYTLAEEMIGLAAKAGAGAVKFQTFRAEHYVGLKNKDRFNMLKSFELGFSNFERLKKVADKAGVLFMSTPFDCQSAKFLEKLVPAYKISSGDNIFYPLLDVVAKTGKPIIISCGLIGLEQIKTTEAYIKDIWEKNDYVSELAFLHCVANYPVEKENANLLAIKMMCENLDCVVGYSDHCLGIDAAVASVALGAQIIEKHFTLDKNFSNFRDHQLSADPDEMIQLVKGIRGVEKMLGFGKVTLQKSEEEIESLMRRSIVAVTDLPKGHVLSKEDLSWVRPAGGISPGKEDKIIGKKLNRDLRAGDMILQEHCV